METVVYYDRQVGAVATLDIKGKDKQWFIDFLAGIEKSINTKKTNYNQMQIILHLSKKVIYVNAIWTL